MTISPTTHVPEEEDHEGSPIVQHEGSEGFSHMRSPPLSSARGFQSDANDADQSGAEETEEGEELSTGRDESDEKPQIPASKQAHRGPQPTSQESRIRDKADTDDDEEDEGEEEEVDPEVKRRMEIRERMAKMSGGMGMAGMFGPPGGMPGVGSRKQTSLSSERKGSGHSTTGVAESSSRAPPVPIMPMPGMQRSHSPEQEMDVDREPLEPPKSIVQGREPEEMPDVQDMEAQPVVPSRKSTDRPVPPPVPQGKWTLRSLRLWIS